MNQNRHLNPIQFIGINLAVACSYFILGYIGILLAIAPSNASPVWPAAGVALAVALVYGRQIVPGLFIGTLALQILSFLDFSASESILPSLIAGTVSSLGSCAQALLGAYFINHNIGKHPPLIKDKEILYFFLFGAIISCLVAPTMGISTIYFQGLITAKDIPFSWFTWWAGDAIGVIIFTPIILSFIANPRSLWKERKKLVSYPLLFTFILVISVFQYNQKQETARIASIFERQASIFHFTLNSEIKRHLETNEMLKGLYDSSQQVTEQEFATLTRPIIKKHQSIQALEWISFIPENQRSQFESSKNGGLIIRESNQEREMVPATERAEYFPITYVQPQEGNEQAFGFDVGTNPTALTALLKARDTGNTVITKPIQLIPGLEKKTGFVFYSPVYHKNKPINSTDDKKTALNGFVAGVFRIEDEIEEVFSDFPNVQLSFTIADQSNRFYSNFPESKSTNLNLLSLQKILQIPVADKIWSITYQPSAEFYHNQLTWTLWWILLVGFIITSLISMGLLMLAGRTLRTEELVHTRTHDLTTSEERWQFALEGAREGVWDWNVVSNEVFFSSRFKEILGYAESEFDNNFDAWKKHIHPDDKKRVLADVKRYFDHELSIYENEHRMICKDGSCIWILVRGKVVSWTEDNKPLRMIGTHADITERKQAEELLRQNEAQFRNLFENAEVSIWNENMSEVIDELDQLRQKGVTDLQQYLKDNHSTVTDLASKIRVFQVNEATLKLLSAKSQDDFLYSIHNTFGPNTLKVFADELCAIWEGKDFFRSEAEYISLDGRNITAIVSFHIPDNVEGFKSIPVSVIDITDRKIAEEKLQLSAKVFSETNEGITITDAKGNILDVNPAFCKITGYSREEVIGQNPRILSSGKQGPEFYAEMWHDINAQGHWQGEVWNRRKNGPLYAELLSISSILDEEGNILHFVGIFTDITHSKRQQEILEQMAHYDVLTKLPNRVLLTDRFILALAHSKRQESLLAICFLDLDNFKPINDIYGHETGDQLLVEVAERIKANIRDEDTVSRLGGDEFALLLGDIESFPHCEKMLKRINESLAQPYLIDDQSLLISASIGVSLYPMDNSDFDTLLRHADQAMYQAKLAGRNRYGLFNTEQDQLFVQKTIKLKEIQKALINNEFCLYYQPKVNMATGKVFGVEALIRWNHPEKGLIPPLEFLPVIKETELEIKIGNWAINKTLKQLKRWNENGIELEVSVNISSYHLQSSSFVADLEESLALNPKVHSKSLQLEILESSALGDLHSISRIIKTCINALGINIALDDFGTGYSSLTHLRNLPAQTIKIDQSFVRDMLDDPNDYAIIDSVIGLANSFNREVIAEGVETTDHGLMLVIMGCNEAQGYGIARPMPVTEIQDWLRNYIPKEEWIACANKVRTPKESKIKLFRLTLAQWQKHFKKKLQSSPGSIEQWPILIRTKCHCGIWIKRAKQEQLFEENWLIKLDEAHDTMHDIADDLFNTYQRGEIDNARNRIKDFQIALENMNSLLGQCE